MCSVILPITDMSAAESPAEVSGQEEGELKGTKRKMSLSRCGMCGSEEAKYRCPACLAHSCSMACVKKHKENSGCSGVRDKTAFVSLSQFDEITLLSDYRYLEDTGRFADGATRDPLIRSPRITSKAKKLAANARNMNITLRFLPVTFTKSRENSTLFLTKEKRFLWHLKLIFPQSNTEFSRIRVSDTQTVEQILTHYIHPTESDPVTRQKLKMYVQAPFDHVKVFMKAEGRKANSLRYHELDIQKSLRDNLSYKMLIEYPVLHVVLQERWKDYPLKGPAEPASTQSCFAKKDLDQVAPSLQGSLSTGGTNNQTGIHDTSHETEPPVDKKAKRESGVEELEDGEIADSGEEDEEENIEENGFGDGNNPTNDMQVIQDELGVDVDITVDGDINEHEDISRDQCINEDLSVLRSA